MTNFILDTPYRKEWWLPDHSHRFIQFILGDTLFIRVTTEFGQTVLSHQIDMNKPGWKELMFLAQDLAAKRFKSQRIRDNVPKVLSGTRREV